MCTSSSCSDSGSDGAASSTPFLATWNGEKFSLENDFLFSKPRTNSSVHFSIAKRMYEEKADQGDKYIIQNKVEPMGSKLVFQIREIEPEISYIDSLKISCFEKKKDHLYFTTSDHKEVLSIEKTSFKKSSLKQSAIYNKTVDISKEMSDRLEKISSNKNGRNTHPSFKQELEKNDFVEIESITTEGSAQPYLFLESRYRDWTIGEIFKGRGAITRNINFYQFHTLKNWLKSPLKMLSLALIFALSYIGFNQKKEDASQESILSQAFDISVAKADLPVTTDGNTKSLLVDYYDHASQDFKNIEIVEPRYFQPSAYFIKIPQEAIQDNKILIKITATKKHHITCAQIVSPQEKDLSPVTTKNLELTKAYNRRTKEDNTEKLSQKDKNYLVTWPGDIVDLEFQLSQEQLNKTENLGFVLEAHGFYTSASKEVQKKLGDWAARLDPESAAFLKELHTLNAAKNKIAISL